MKLIDKDALAAEIERRFKEHYSKKNNYASSDQFWRAMEDKNILSFIDTLEVKEVDLEKNVRQVIDLYLEAGKYYNGIIKKERDECGGSDFAIKLLNGLIDAKELGIQYVLDKLKAQKGEEV